MMSQVTAGFPPNCIFLCRTTFPDYEHWVRLYLFFIVSVFYRVHRLNDAALLSQSSQRFGPSMSLRKKNKTHICLWLVFSLTWNNRSLVLLLLLQFLPLLFLLLLLPFSSPLAVAVMLCMSLYLIVLHFKTFKMKNIILQVRWINQLFAICPARVSVSSPASV